MTREEMHKKLDEALDDLTGYEVEECGNAEYGDYSILEFVLRGSVPELTDIRLSLRFSPE
jgi:hypothetical protein